MVNMNKMILNRAVSMMKAPKQLVKIILKKTTSRIKKTANTQLKKLTVVTCSKLKGTLKKKTLMMKAVTMMTNKHKTVSQTQNCPRRRPAEKRGKGQSRLDILAQASMHVSRNP